MHFRHVAPIALLWAAIAGSTCVAMPVAPAPMALDGRLLVESLAPSEKTTDLRTLRAPADVRSGDRLIFLIRYRNQGTMPLPGYDFVAPVPPGVRILPDRFGSVRISADGGRSWTRPDSPLRLDANHRLRLAGDVAPTHVRLRLDRRIAPGETGTVAYRGLLL
ncbi:hypothetical protein BH10PSE13_BH10PSE13_23090 [soil metagenome]